jgi:hypothetical protein
MTQVRSGACLANSRFMNRLTVVLFLAMAGCKSNGADDAELKADDSPVQHSDISPRAPKGCGGGFYSVHYGDAYKTLREAEEFKPGLRDYYVRELSDRHNEYLDASISPTGRKEWFSSHKIAEKDQQCLSGLFDAIGAAAKRTLPNYRPRGYTHHDSGEESLMREAIKEEFPGAEVLGVGLKMANWEIEKHSNGIPSSRYKYGMVWLKSPAFEDGFCRIAYVNVVGDYAGGSSYADTKANYISVEPAGCR